MGPQPKTTGLPGDELGLFSAGLVIAVHVDKETDRHLQRIVQVLNECRPANVPAGKASHVHRCILLSIYDAKAGFGEREARHHAVNWIRAAQARLAKQRFEWRIGGTKPPAVQATWRSVAEIDADLDQYLADPANEDIARVATVVPFRCAVCGERQFEVPGGRTCMNGEHGGADSVECPFEQPKVMPRIELEIEDSRPCSVCGEPGCHEQCDDAKLLRDGYGIETSPVEPKQPDLPPPSPEQERALSMAINHPGHCIVTGEPGTGKSFVTKHLARRIPVMLTGTTGRAALNIGGITIDRLMCFNRDDWTIRNHDRLRDNMQGCPRTILVDEASMAGRGMMHLIERVAKTYNKRLILVGDWAQASPVLDDWGVTTPLFQQSQLIRLVEPHRQADPIYLGALKKLRYGTVDDEVRAAFQRCLVAVPPDDEAVVRMFATNRETDTYNDNRLLLVADQTPIVEMKARWSDMRDFDRQSKWPIDEAQRERHCDESALAHNQGLRIGSRVIMTMNDPEDDFVNGDTGTLVDIRLNDGRSTRDRDYHPFTPTSVKASEVDHLLVQRDRGGLIVVPRFKQEVKEMFQGSLQPAYQLEGFPIRLGWAMTIHRAQGMTLDRAFIDLSSILRMPGESRHGLAYVGLSRTRALEGLQIANWHDAAVYCSPVVRPYI